MCNSPKPTLTQIAAEVMQEGCSQSDTQITAAAGVGGAGATGLYLLFRPSSHLLSTPIHADPEMQAVNSLHDALLAEVEYHYLGCDGEDFNPDW